jgi:hypothetical protein
MPKDEEEHTPPRGGARVKPMTEHQMIDLGEQQRRMSKKVFEMHQGWPEITGAVREWRRTLPVIELAMKPIVRSKWERLSLPVIAACAVVFVLFELVTHTSSATVPEPSQRGTQAGR